MTMLKQCQDKRQWDDYILENNGHPLQLWGWGDLKQAHNWIADRLFLTDDKGDTIGAVQLLIRKLPWPFKSLSYVPRGPVVSAENRAVMLSQLVEYTKVVHRSVALSIEPDAVEFDEIDGWKRSNNHVLPSNTIILDLEKTESELLADMVKKTRQYIRKSAAETMQIKVVKQHEELQKCLGIYHDTNKRAKFNIHRDQYYYDVFDKLGDHSQVFAAYVDNQPVAFLWLAISADTSYELYGGVNELGQQLRLNYALKWHAIKKCKEWELTRYDFGGLIDGGVSTFKRGWASEETNLAGTFDFSLSIFYGLWNKGLPTAKKLIHKIESIFHHR